MAKTYHISFDNSNWIEFFPSNSPVVSTEKYGDEMFKRYAIDEFRIVRNVGSLTWLVDYKNEIVTDTNGDKIQVAGNESIWDTIYTMFFDSSKFSDPLYFKIQKNGVDKYFFQSSVNEAKIDTQNGVFEISPRTDDDYYDVLNLYDTKYADRAGSLFGTTNIYYPDNKGNQFINVDFAVFLDTTGGVTWTNSGAAVEQVADYTLTTNFNGQVVQITIANYITTGLNIRLRLWDTVGAAAVSTDTIITGDGVYTLTQNAASTGAVAVRMAQPNAAPPNVTGSFNYVIYEPAIKTSAGSDLKTFIQRLLGSSFMNVGLTAKSTYLWNDTLETDAPSNIDTYITANPANDYVVEGTAIWNDLFFGRVDAWATEQNIQAEISLKEILDILKYKLRAWWFIDSDGALRIEHEKYFKDYNSQINISDYSAFKPEVDVKKYLYDKGDIVNTLSYSDVNAVNSDFVANPIIYDPLLTTVNTKDIIVDVTTDIENIIDNSDSVYNTGVFLIRSIPILTLCLIAIDENTLIPSTFNMNAKLGWAYLFANYFGYFGEANEADINDGTTLTLDGVKEFLKQDNIRFFYEGELDWKKPVTLSNGTAWIQKIEESDSEFVTLNVGFDPYL